MGDYTRVSKEELVEHAIQVGRLVQTTQQLRVDVARLEAELAQRNTPSECRHENEKLRRAEAELVDARQLESDFRARERSDLRERKAMGEALGQFNEGLLAAAERVVRERDAARAAVAALRKEGA